MDKKVMIPGTFLHWLYILFLSFFLITAATSNLSQIYAASQQDTEPPISNVTLLGNWNGFYYTSSVEVHISAIDSPSNQSQDVKYTAYRINSGAWIKYTDPFIIHNEGIYTISYFSEDYNNNPEQVKTTQFEINTNIPSPSPEPTQIVYVTSVPIPTSQYAATMTPTPTTAAIISPSVTPTKTPTPIFQFFPAPFSNYRSPTKKPTATPYTIQTAISNKLTTLQAKTPTPAHQLDQEAVSTNHHDEPQNILGQWTKVENDRPESSNSFFVLILAIVILLAYISFVYYYYSKIKN